MRRSLTLAFLCLAAVLAVPASAVAGNTTLRDRVHELRQEVESLKEDVDDLREPVAEFELFDQCAYTIGVTQHGKWNGNVGYLFGQGGQRRRPALAIDMRGFGASQFDFLAFPGEEPPSIECNEDAGEEFIDN